MLTDSCSIIDIAKPFFKEFLWGLFLFNFLPVFQRGKEYLEKERAEISEKLKKLGVEDSLIKLEGMTQGMLVVLGEKNIKKLKDFADLSSDELIGGMDEFKGKRVKINGYLEDFNLTREEADKLVMSARNIVFGD